MNLKKINGLFNSKVKLIFSLILLINLFSINNSLAGKLDDFESDATKPNESIENSSAKKTNENGDTNDSCEGNFFACLIFDILAHIIGEMVEGIVKEIFNDLTSNVDDNTEYAAGGIEEGNITIPSTIPIPVENNEPKIYKEEPIVYKPTAKQNQPITISETDDPGAIEQLMIENPPYFNFKVLYNLSVIDPNIYGHQVGLNASRNIFGIDIRLTHFYEKNPEDKLNILQLSGFMKIVNNSQWDWDLGLSSYAIVGNQKNIDLFFYTDVQIKYSDNFRLGIRPSIGQINDNTIHDIEVHFGMTSFKQLTTKLGYRVIKSPNSSLHGPFVGVEYRF